MSASDQLEFTTRKCTITLDYNKCLPARDNKSDPACGFACVKACRLMGRNILKIENNRPVLTVTDPEELKRLDNECLACEYNCSIQGSGCINIEVRLD
jgi:hypothetical protein